MTYVTDKLLMMIILCGQEQMVTRIDRFPEIRSRMFPASLSSLSRAEAEEMMRFRWSVASKSKSNAFPFTKEAIDAIFNYSKGIPRSICQVSDVALLAAFNQEKKEINEELVKLVVHALATKEENKEGKA
jgi:general secretion pathway protein A